MFDRTPYRPLFPLAERYAYFNHAGRFAAQHARRRGHARLQ